MKVEISRKIFKKKQLKHPDTTHYLGKKENTSARKIFQNSLLMAHYKFKSIIINCAWQAFLKPLSIFVLLIPGLQEQAFFVCFCINCCLFIH